jgi:transposase
MERFGLCNDQWERIKPILPGREGHVGGTAQDNRLFVEAVLYRFRTGCPWRDLPERFATGNRSINVSADGPRVGFSIVFSSFWPAITTTST